jgi:hypothetical protein
MAQLITSTRTLLITVVTTLLFKFPPPNMDAEVTTVSSDTKVPAPSHVTPLSVVALIFTANGKRVLGTAGWPL